MKTAIVLLSLTLSLVAHAQRGGDKIGSGDPVPQVLAVHFPSNPLYEVPMVRTVEIYANGQVLETIIKNLGSPEQEVKYNTVTVLTPKEMERVNICSSEFSKRPFKAKVVEYCMDDAGVHYKGVFGEKNFAVSYCGQLQSLSGKCAKDMVKLLDILSR